jgi:hypothetical protein
MIGLVVIGCLILAISVRVSKITPGTVLGRLPAILLAASGVLAILSPILELAGISKPVPVLIGFGSICSFCLAGLLAPVIVILRKG